jgi:predicted  nucleic acid-binding Zn-ribbon protein
MAIKKNSKKESKLEELALNATNWLGTTKSLIIHTVIFGSIYALVLFNIPFDKIQLTLTTIISIEAIYLSLFIQLAVNHTKRSLEDVGEDIDEIQEDVQGLEGGFGEIQEDVEDLEGNMRRMRRGVQELEADVEDISEDIDRFYLEEDKESGGEKSAHVESSKSLQNIEKEIIMLSKGILALRGDLENLKKNLP